MRSFQASGGRGWWLALSLSGIFVGLLLLSIFVLFAKGVGIWGINNQIAWAFAITNFVWWIGIGHAGTFISAILYLVRQEWRTSISRFAESMTIFAVLCAGLFPVLHLGRPWFAFWLFPYPNTMDLWPQFRSPLVWDAFAVSTYLIVSLLFWYLGLIPDLAMKRDAAKNSRAQKIYGFFAVGWRGSALHWRYYKTAYLLLAGLATPLVISVHSIVGMDFAYAILPGWHSSIFPPYFVAGAIFSGFAMVLTLAILLRRSLGLADLVTAWHLDCCAKFTLAMSVIVSYGYATEVFMAYFSGEAMEISMVENRFFGPYWKAAWVMLICNVLLPQFLWSRRVRYSVKWLFGLSLAIQLGMWLERYVIIVTSLSRSQLQSSWGIFRPTIWDFSTLFGSMGLFAFGYLLFVRFLPVVAIAEVKEETAQKKRSA